MRTIMILCSLLFASYFVTLNLVSCNSKGKTVVKEQGKQGVVSADTSSSPRISFDKRSYDFGKINSKKTDSVSVDFIFRNTGELPLIIHKVDLSCSCLSVVYPKSPIKKDSTGSIRITVNPKLVSGVFKKSIFVNSNAVTDVELLKVGGSTR